MVDEQNRQPIVIVGAGSAGTALLEIFLEDGLAQVLGMVDVDDGALGIRLAKAHAIPCFSNIGAALERSGACIVFNMTRDESVSQVAAGHVGIGSVVGGDEARLFWKLISRMRGAQKLAQENHARMQAVLHNVREGIVSINSQGVIESANPAIEQVFGYRPDELIGNNISMLMPEPDRGRHDGYIRGYLQTGKRHVIGRYREVTGLHRDGHQLDIELNVAEMDVDGAKHFVGLIRDVSERKQAEEEITRLALYDQLTSLPNRTLFYQNLDIVLAQARRLKSMCALLFIDLDGFKAVNDTLGHEAGDYLLKEVGQRLQKGIRASDLVARIGGDEFTILLNNLHGPDFVPAIAAKLIEAVNMPAEFKGRSCHVGASIGIALFPIHATDADALVKEADTAMYTAKEAGKNGYVMVGHSAEG